MKLLAVAEILLAARRHMVKLQPQERRRLVELVRLGHGRRRNLTPEEQRELSELISKAQAREFLGDVADKLSPVPVPPWVRGRRRD